MASFVHLSCLRKLNLLLPWRVTLPSPSSWLIDFVPRLTQKPPGNACYPQTTSKPKRVSGSMPRQGIIWCSLFYIQDGVEREQLHVTTERWREMRSTSDIHVLFQIKDTQARVKRPSESLPLNFKAFVKEKHRLKVLRTTRNKRHLYWYSVNLLHFKVRESFWTNR